MFSENERKQTAPGHCRSDSGRCGRSGGAKEAPRGRRAQSRPDRFHPRPHAPLHRRPAGHRPKCLPEAKLLWLPGQLKQLALHARPGRRLSWKGSSRTPGRPHPAHPAALEDGAPVFPPHRRAWSSAEQMRRSLHTVQFSETAGFSQDCASKSKLNLFCFHLKN